MNPDSYTLTSSEISRQSSDGPQVDVLWLVLVWCREEPHRIGERMAVPADTTGIFGRGAGAVREGRRLFLQQLRPGAPQPTAPLHVRRISRQQWTLRTNGQTVQIDNVGRCRLRHNGQPVEHATVSPGDLVEIVGEMLFLCEVGPVLLPSLPSDIPMQPFGEPDPLGLVGESAVMWMLRRELYFLGPREAHVLIRGESGTGKELVAQGLHQLSARAARPMISRNAATLPEGIIDAELFGNLRNYPNPGTPERPGLIGAASGSTLFLDEFAEMPERLQSHLLRVLDAGEYQRLGESRVRTADLRLIAATNRPLSRFKHDVLARLTLRLEIPGLDRRRSDVPLLARFLMSNIAATDAAIRSQFCEGGAARFSVRFIEQLVTYPYKTHVRELTALLWRSLMASSGATLDAVR
ncbi:MAG: sigma 54-interacting transcriptional regulator [Myxococcota bacterium]